MRARHILFVSFLIIIASTFVNAQTKKNQYTSQWRKIDSLIGQRGLTKTALTEVNKIYAAAKKEQNDAQIIKSLVFALNLQEELQENGSVNTIASLEKEIPGATQPAKSILQSLLAQAYWTYFNQQRWRLYERTATVNFKKDDVATWGADDFHKRIGELFLSSIASESILLETKLEPFDAIITKGNVRNLRPTLFDLLANRALEYFSSDERTISRPAYSFEIGQAVAFAEAERFAGFRFETADSLSLHFKALQLYQRLIRAHSKDPNPAALIDIDIHRIQFVNRYSTMEPVDKDFLYRNALKRIGQKYPTEKAAAQALYLIAEAHARKAQLYDHLKDTAGRYEYINAVNISNQLVARKDSSEGVVNARRLLKQINQKELALQAEKVNLRGQPFRILINYRNFSLLHVRIIKMDRDTKDKLGPNAWEESYWKAVAKLPSIKTFAQALPVTTDHQKHSVELDLDALPGGEYALLASPDPSFSTGNEPLVMQYFYVSDIAFINHLRDFFVLHRETGQPLSGAKVQVWYTGYDYNKRKWSLTKGQQLTAGKNGHFNVNEPKPRERQSLRFEITTENDRLFLDDQEEPYRFYRDPASKTNADREKFEKENRRTYYFTDRGIYRPGQLVYFKSIVLTKDFTTRQAKVIAGEKTTIYLRNHQGEQLDSIQLTSNEFGSVSGKFRLPENRLTGIYMITDDKSGSAEFSVEEYKRPKFYVEIDKPAGSYRVNDTITVTGSVKAYAGNNIDGAKIKYRVVRTARFPYPWLMWKRGFQRVTPQEIAHGQLTTGADGKFSLRFPAIPDKSVSTEFDPIFNYEITSDVTDISGETRTGSSSVSVSYKSLQLAITLPGETMVTDSLRSVPIKSLNLAGEFVPALVNVSIYKLNAPQRLIRERYWEQPDTFLLSRTEYLQLFPYDEYSNESKKESWERLEKIFDRSDSVKINNATVKVPALQPGWYAIEATTRDRHGATVKDVKYVQLLAPGGRPATPSYSLELSPGHTRQPGEQAVVELGSSAKDVFVVQLVDKARFENSSQPDTDGSFNFFTLSNETKRLTFPVTEADRGGFGVLHAFVKHNRFYATSAAVLVPWTNKELNISYETFRDKALPGSLEKWKVKLTGSKNEKVASEVLTAMYDASLDQFRSNAWNMSDVWPVWAGHNQWAAHSNFSLLPGIVKYISRDLSYYHKQYDELLNMSDRPIHRKLARSAAPPVMEQANLEGSAAGLQTQNLDMAEASSVGIAGDVMLAKIRGAATTGGQPLLMIVDGVIFEGIIDELNTGDIVSISILKGADAIAAYGANAANGVIVITTKSGAQNKDAQVQLRKNFEETAFFFPDLKTDTAGNIEFSFTLPEALTQWKWMLLSHTKDLAIGYSEKAIVTQKELMLQPNLPRFVREGDRMDLSAKIVNMTDREMSGQLELQLVDATNNQSADGWFQNMFPNQYFTVAAGQSSVVNFSIQSPYQFNKPVIIRFIARAGNMSDGEENTLPVLTNKILVTETLPLNVRGGGTKNFTFDKLLKSGESETLGQHALTVEFTSNPAWYAVQALPYLMEYPYECSEQVWNRVYANALAARIANASPRIKEIFQKWKTTDTAALLSNLQKNEELKSVLLQETPWVLEAKNETEQKKRIALLFDMVKLGAELDKNLDRLLQLQSENGGFVWFKGGPDDRYITQYILTGIGHLKKLNAIPAAQQKRINEIVKRAIPYLDKRIKEDYDNLLKRKADLAIQQVSYIQVHYLYMRSYFNEIDAAGSTAQPFNYYRKQAQQFWVKQSRYLQGMTALALYRTGDGKTATDILRSLKQNAIVSDELGMYWKDMTGGYYWYQAPIETQSLLIEAFSEITKDMVAVDNLKTWLLRNKQTNNWNTTKATADACYALLLQGTDWLTSEPVVQVKLGDRTISSLEQKTEAGSGYFKKVFQPPFVNSKMGNITVNVTHPNNSTTGKPAIQSSWGAVYWQYFENLENITPAATPLKLSKKLFVERMTDRGPVLEPISENGMLKTGDKVKVRIELRVDRDMEYVHMKDMRASALEPVNVISSYKFQGGLGYYESTKDASTNFFFNYLPKGTYVFEYALFVTHTGTFSNGITSIQCMYAPEFSSHSEGVKINVE